MFKRVGVTDTWHLIGRAEQTGFLGFTEEREWLAPIEGVVLATQDRSCINGEGWRGDVAHEHSDCSKRGIRLNEDILKLLGIAIVKIEIPECTSLISSHPHRDISRGLRIHQQQLCSSKHDFGCFCTVFSMHDFRWKKNAQRMGMIYSLRRANE